MKQISTSDIDELSAAAQASPRKRANLNLHAELSGAVQRLAIAMEPATVIFPHRHPHTWELLTPLRGRFVVLNFDDAGVVTDRRILGADTAVLEMAPGQWHAVLSLDAGAVIFEVKRGPYAPIAEADVVPWAAGGAGEQALLAWYAVAQPGSRYRPTPAG